LIGLLTLAVYAPAVRYDFTTWDDDVNICLNKNLNPVKWDSVLNFWIEPYEHFYTPVTYTLWAIQAAVSPIVVSPIALNQSTPGPLLFHATNIFCHLISGLLVFMILSTLLVELSRDDAVKLSPDLAAAAGTLLFLLHPAQVEPVVWISGFRDVLSGLFSFLSLWTYLRYLKSGSRSLYFFSATVFVLALLSKPSSAILPAIIFLVDVYAVRRRAWLALTEILPWSFFVIACVLMNREIQAGVIQFATPLAMRPFIALDSIAFYLGKLVWPASLIPNYARKPEWVLDWGYFHLTALIPIAVFFGLTRLPRAYRRAGLIGFWIFTLVLLPSSGIVPFISQNESTVFDRYLYVAMLGPAFGLAFVMMRIRSRAATSLCFAWLIALALIAGRQRGYWTDTSTLFSHQLAMDPNSYAAHRGLGLYNMKIKQFDRAREHFESAVRINPNDQWSRDHLALAQPNAVEAQQLVEAGVSDARSGNYDEASRKFEAAVKLDPSNSSAHTDLGNLYAMKRNYEAALASFKRSIELNPNIPATYVNLGNALRLKGDQKAAVEAYTKALKLDPDFEQARRGIESSFIHSIPGKPSADSATGNGP